jgi:hypothetical protein
MSSSLRVWLELVLPGDDGHECLSGPGDIESLFGVGRGDVFINSSQSMPVSCDGSSNSFAKLIGDLGGEGDLIGSSTCERD